MRILLFVFSLAFCLQGLPLFTNAQIVRDSEFDSALETLYKTQIDLAGKRMDKVFNVLDYANNADEKQALKFMLSCLPLSDLADYEGSYFLGNVRMSLKAREETAWGKSIPGDIFLNFVLPVRVNNENLDDFRTEMYDEILDRVKGLTMEQAALEINHWCHEKVTYRPTDERTSAPLSTVRTSYGRCGEESTFFVAALRTAGIPARQVYTPRWAHTDDNHAWVEVWVDGKWYFLGACEPSPALDMGWFAAPSTRTMLVNTRVFGLYRGDEPVIVREKRFAELNRTGNYTPVKKIFVVVSDASGVPVQNARVEYRLYNYAEFYPLAKTYTDASGITGFTSGLGSLLIWASKNDDFGYKVISVIDADTIRVMIGDGFTDGKSEEYHLVPPQEQKIAVVQDADVKLNDLRLAREDSIRNTYMSTFRDSSWALGFLKEIGVTDKSAVGYIAGSAGNWKEITSFLKNTSAEHRTLAVKLLGVISAKDLRDTKESVLRDHLNNSVAFSDNFKDDDKVFEKYVMSGRIANEMLTAWRLPVIGHYKKGSRESGMDTNPESIAGWILSNIKIDNVANMHSRAPLSPQGVLELGVCDSKSRDILFVASCRAFGFPARLNPASLVPQYLSGPTWKDVIFDGQVSEAGKKGFVHFINEGSFVPKYYINFTIGIFRNGVFNSLEFDEGKSLDSFPDSVEVPAGKYMLVTGNRKSDGSVLNGIYFFEVKENEIKNVVVKVSDVVSLTERSFKIDFETVLAEIVADEVISPLSGLMRGNDCVFALIDPDKEPTKHLLNDIAVVKYELDALNLKFIFLVEPGLNKDFLKNIARDNLPVNSVFAYDKDNSLLNKIRNSFKSDKTINLPVVLIPSGNDSAEVLLDGYSIGSGEQILKKFKKE